MVDPFAAALDAQFNAPGSAAAVYIPIGAQAYPVRAILSGQDEELPVGGGAIVTSVTLIELRRAQVPLPRNGEFVVIGGVLVDGKVTGGDVYELRGEAMSDVERITWKIGAEPSDASALP